MEANDQKMKGLQAIFSSVFGFILPLTVPANIQKLTNTKKQSLRTYEGNVVIQRTANVKDLFQNVRYSCGIICYAKVQLSIIVI